MAHQTLQLPRSAFAPLLPPYLACPRPRPRNRLTDAEREQRRRKLGLPCALDQWLHKSLPVASNPSSEESEGIISTGLWFQDHVECTGLVEEPFQDPPTYTLYMNIRLPPSSGFLIYYWTSPHVILDTYIGENTDLEAPDWVNLISSPRAFWQPRSHMIEVVAELSTTPNNEKLSAKILAWSTAVSRSSRLQDRRGHLQRDKLAMAARNQLEDEPTSLSNITQTMNEGPSTPPQPARSLPATPTRPFSVGQPPGTPISARRTASLCAQEERARNLQIDMLSELNEVPEVLMDDDWEEPLLDDDDAAQESTASITPFSRVSATSNLSPVSSTPNPINYTSEGPSNLAVPIADGVPEHKHAENDPDPFFKLGATDNPLPAAPTTVHLHHGIYLLYVLVAWLHLQFHLPVRACSALISVVALIIQAFGQTINPPPITTLHRVMNRLDVEPTFDILPTCPNCLEVYPDMEDTPTICANCSSFIFKAANPRLAMNSQAPVSTTRTPLLRFPYKSIQSQLASILSLPGIEEELDGWRKRQRTPGKYFDVFDGDIPKNIKAHDGTRFFRNDHGDLNGPEGELRIALTLGVDWFSYLRSQIAPSHTSGPISFNIANLRDHLRYRTANLLLGGIMPGPKEGNPDQCQRFLRIIVNELLCLWRHGVRLPTPSCPEGRLIRVILIWICCDKPAAHKMGGFGSHSHTMFCTRCWIKQADKASSASFQKNGFRTRTDAEHRKAGEKYAHLKSASAREDFVKQYAARWSEFARLPYFDLVRMIVIDPMHNLLLGLVKTHFYHIWVQGKILRKTKELRALHNILSNFSMPAYLGRLQSLVGIPTGGSLTADQWLLMAVVVGPIAIPQIWHDYMPDPVAARRQRDTANKAHIDKKVRAAETRKQKAAAKKSMTEQRQAQDNTRNSQPEQTLSTTLDNTSTTNHAAMKRSRRPPDEDVDSQDEDEDLPSCLHPDDPANFLKLGQALRLFLAREISDAQIDVADGLLREYCQELVVLYGPDVIKPNHHYATHTSECLRDFGPMHGFWTFLFERLNKVLKSYKTNNHGGGELETTFFREFHRTVATSHMVAQAARSDQPEYFQAAVQHMFDATADDRGTVQALARDLEEHHKDDGVIFSLSPRFERREMDSGLYAAVLRHVSILFPHLKLRSLIVTNPTSDSIPLMKEAFFFDYAVVNQCRYLASKRARNSMNSLVKVFISEAGETWDIFVGFVHFEWI
ncbi:uncharacterized protein LACBIDRAFT_323939 [Laccaria bicolor S238N-H82]|uniref:Predicted protein n=1 Tax=Laccaria bicolor (strain S238N-H82 / ATCC MYA-4686) TaxID=486041 RepID=B0D040_LACBS|nr:uncharacterized protein LACBIDRAFT_323939 [Laccaria bicolor S238N-H82]EDR11390.1 predicted protein [Laccaria bicolor S238N-H82]|eukprot:XP_001877287.1 predicted protein [Laccaria bicolor S238N-H82]